MPFQTAVRSFPGIYLSQNKCVPQVFRLLWLWSFKTLDFIVKMYQKHTGCFLTGNAPNSTMILTTTISLLNSTSTKLRLSPASNCNSVGRTQWPCGLKRGSAAARLLCGFESRRGHGCLFLFECCVLSGRRLCVGLIIPPEESYRVLCVWVWSWNLEIFRPLVQYCCAMGKKKHFMEGSPS